ncbi:RluA family pseudouridine synthase [Cytobacillus oceanisediminis]|jgi:23S rRNA pseudouridine1911/1915/1917 synthase|uniref:RluA family pseudouridine synthase n=1 Tax=Cytobacillus oceanisediminis TaxID=665099 RepID=UPI001C23D57E|nr:RluA family pseudouridine synthase [Cytobacillus oceanisediminis]MBU8768173.1 RluA family pseudouridine synthase [Cytobacillus oceanisediminis]USK45776.1 RluA family pseudouridine synthase [Cytobacillus oceanisediminis]
MARFELQWKITAPQAGSLIRGFLKENDISKTALTDIKFAGGFIKVNNQEVNVRYELKEGDILQVGFPEEVPSKGMKGEDLPLDILYEDAYLLIVNKPAGVSTIPSREHPSGSLANRLIGYYQRIGLKSAAHIVTRLDRDTSGLVLIAKHRHVHHLFSQQQRFRKIQRTYEAFAEGTISRDAGTIEQPIARKKDSIIEREVSEAGQYACTHYQVISRRKEFTHVKLKLETGRTHQIRVHLAWLGYPLAGDELYGGTRQLIRRQALHCCSLSFYHPFLHRTLMFEQELPEDMNCLL